MGFDRFVYRVSRRTTTGSGQSGCSCGNRVNVVGSVPVRFGSFEGEDFDFVCARFFFLNRVETARARAFNL
jgi:hypothetical protein